MPVSRPLRVYFVEDNTVIRDRLMNTVHSYPVEALTYALLERWVSVRQAELEATNRG